MEERQQPISAPPMNAPRSPKRVHSACPRCNAANPKRLGFCPNCGTNLSRYVVVTSASSGAKKLPRKRKQRTKKRSRVQIEVGDKFTYKYALTYAVVRAVTDDGHMVIYDEVAQRHKDKYVDEQYNLTMSRGGFLKFYNIKVVPTPPPLIIRHDDSEVTE